MSKGILSFLAGAASGYMKGTMMDRDMKQEDEDRAARKEDREYVRKIRAREESDRATLAAAGAEPDVGAGGMTKPVTADNRDVGQPGEPGAADGGLTPGVTAGGKQYATRDAAMARDAITERTAAAYRKIGKPAEAIQLENSAVAVKAAKFALDKAQKQFLDEQFDKKTASITNPKDLENVLSGSELVQGRKVSSVTSPDGKSVQLVTVGDDGSQQMLGKPFSNDEAGVQKAIIAWSQSMTTGQKITAMQHLQTFEEGRRQFDETKRIQQEQFQENKRLQEKQIGISAANLGVAQGGLKLNQDKYEADLKRDPMRNVPPVVDMTVKGLDKALGTIETTITKAMADGNWDPKGAGPQELLTRQADLTRKRNALLKPYMEAANDAAGGGKPGATPAAYKPGGAGKPAVQLAPIVPAGQAASQAASRGLPRSLEQVPGAQDTSTRVARGIDLRP